MKSGLQHVAMTVGRADQLVPGVLTKAIGTRVELNRLLMGVVTGFYVTWDMWVAAEITLADPDWESPLEVVETKGTP